MDTTKRYAAVPASAWWWLLAAVLATVVDGGSTWWLLQDGRAAEANPWLAGLVHDHGAATAMGVRIAVGCALLAALGATLPFSRLALPGLRVVTVVLGAVLCWHVVVHLLAVPVV